MSSAIITIGETPGAPAVMVRNAGHPSVTGRYLWHCYHGSPVRAVASVPGDNDPLVGRIPHLDAQHSAEKLARAIVTDHPRGWDDLTTNACLCADHPACIAPLGVCNLPTAPWLYRITNDALHVSLWDDDIGEYFTVKAYRWRSANPPWDALNFIGNRFLIGIA